MADIAVENILTTNLKAYIIALDTTRFNRSNVLIVPKFTEPPMHWTDIMVQIRYPEVMPFGQAGWSYVQRITYDIAIFKRNSKDPKKEWEAILTDLGECNRLIRMRVNNYNGGAGTGLPLPIRLFDSHQVMTPRTLEDEEGRLIKDVAWTSFRAWGLAGNVVENFVAGL